MMQLLKGRRAYAAIALGVLVSLLLRGNWMLRLCAFALAAGGAKSLEGVSRWFFRASIAADVCMVLALVLGPAVIPPGLLRIALEWISLLPLLLFGCMALMGVMQQLAQAGKSIRPEQAVFVIWSAGLIMMLISNTGFLNEWALTLSLSAARALVILGHAGLIFGLLRARHEYVGMEEQA